MRPPQEDRGHSREITILKLDRIWKDSGCRTETLEWMKENLERKNGKYALAAHVAHKQRRLFVLNSIISYYNKKD